MYNSAVFCLLFTLTVMYLVFPSLTFHPIASAAVFIAIKQWFPTFFFSLAYPLAAYFHKLYP